MPPQAICNAYKKYQQMDEAALLADLEIVDFQRGLSSIQQERVVPVAVVSSQMIEAAQKAFAAQITNLCAEKPIIPPDACTIYEHVEFPG